MAAMLHRNCYNVLLFDWRAHGESDGERTTFGYEEVKDLAAALDYVSSRPEVDPERIGVLGNSMGAAIAIRGGAALPQLKAVVSDSPYPSLQDSIEVGVRRRGPLGLWPLRPLALFLGIKTIGVDPDLVRPIDEIDEISPRPVLIMHGGRDELVPDDTPRTTINITVDGQALTVPERITVKQALELAGRAFGGAWGEGDRPTPCGTGGCYSCLALVHQLSLSFSRLM